MPSLANARHENFCLNLVSGMSQTEAYIKAGYSPRGANGEASKLISNHIISARIRELQKASESSKIISVQKRKERLTEIIEASHPDFHDAEGRPVSLTHDTPNVGAVADVTQEYDSGAERMVTTKVKLHDPMKAMDILNKMGGDYPPNKIEVTGQDGGPIRVEDVRERLLSAISRRSPRRGKKETSPES